MPHPLITQLRFTRSEFRRGLEGLSEADAQTRVGKMNCISWNVGHLAWQEQRYWLFRMQDTVLLPDVQEKFAYGAPGFTPPLAESRAAYDAIIAAVDPFLDTLVTGDLQKHILLDGGPDFVTPGTLLLRMTYHYWYHTGENLAIRQALGHTGLPDFVGNIDDEAPYEPH
jgi:DinB superfamily